MPRYRILDDQGVAYYSDAQDVIDELEDVFSSWLITAADLRRLQVGDTLDLHDPQRWPEMDGPYVSRVDDLPDRRFVMHHVDSYTLTDVPPGIELTWAEIFDADPHLWREYEVDVRSLSPGTRQVFDFGAVGQVSLRPLGGRTAPTRESDLRTLNPLSRQPPLQQWEIEAILDQFQDPDQQLLGWRRVSRQHILDHGGSVGGLHNDRFVVSMMSAGYEAEPGTASPVSALSAALALLDGGWTAFVWDRQRNIGWSCENWGFDFEAYIEDKQGNVVLDTYPVPAQVPVPVAVSRPAASSGRIGRARGRGRGRAAPKDRRKRDLGSL